MESPNRKLPLETWLNDFNVQAALTISETTTKMSTTMSITHSQSRNFINGQITQQ
jgi:hypothetical protein